MDMKINNLENQEYNTQNQENNNEDNIEEIINQSEHNTNNDFASVSQEEKLSEYIQVFCRFRPPNESELSFSTNNSVILLSSKKLIITQEKKLELKKDYTFDGLFEYDTSKEIFYQKTSKNIVNAVLQGYNGGIICYGETGTGKSYTLKEIIPQVEQQIFDFIEESDENNEMFKIDLSMIEIYKEQVNDLIDLKNTNLNLIENKSKKLIIDNLTHIGVSSKEQLEQIINKGLNNRNSREYNYNSKSHFIIMITVYHYLKNENYIKIGKLYLVDLEGSERISKFNIEGENLEEQKLINKSLIALSIIIQNLSNENDNITYAPYRDSKLTRIISDCFGGNAYTSLILNCSKHECSTVQTRNTLMFGEKVKKIRNKPIINIENISNGNFLGFLGDDNPINNIENKDWDKRPDKKNKINVEQIKQMKEKINYLNIHIEQLNKRNAILENEKKNIIDKITEGGKNKINKFYIENNINDLHELLNEKEIRENELLNEINSLKIILEKKNKEFDEMKQNHDENIKTCKDLTECLDEAGNQIKNKDLIINELKNKEQINIKDITDLKKELNDLNNDKENIIKTKDDKIKELNENINTLNKTIEELNNEINSKENDINTLTREKESQIKSKENNEKKINQLREQINKLKEENNPNKIRNQKIEMDNINRKYEESNKKIEKLKEENNKLKEKLDLIEKEKKQQPKNYNLENENNTLKNQIKLLEKNYNTISSKNKELMSQLNNQRNNNRAYSSSKDTKDSKDSKEIYNLRQENKRLNEKIVSLEKHKKEGDKLKNEIKNKDKTHEEFEAEFHQMIQDNDEKINEIKNLKKQLDNITRENIRNKNTIDNLRKEISDKNKIIEQNKKDNYNNNRNYSPIYSNRTNSSNKYISDIRQKNEMITKENNENKRVIETLRREIQTKTKLLEENNKYKQCTCDKSLIERLRQEIKSKEYIINDYKNKLANLKDEISSKEKIISEYKKNKYTSNYPQRNNNVLILDTQNRSNNSYGKYTTNSSDNNSGYKFCYNYKRINQNNENEKNVESLHQEINKYKEIIRQKDTEIIKIKKECNVYNNNCCKCNVRELERIINALKLENKQLKDQIIDYDNLKAEIEFIYKRGGNYSFKETNKTSLKLAYDALVEENKQLKIKISKIEKNMK